jgi:hypothetical protein
MFIVFCEGVSSMGKTFENNEDGNKRMLEYIKDCLISFPSSKVHVENFN